MISVVLKKYINKHMKKSDNYNCWQLILHVVHVLDNICVFDFKKTLIKLYLTYY